MQRHQLEHLIRAAAAITNEVEVGEIGVRFQLFSPAAQSLPPSLFGTTPPAWAPDSRGRNHHQKRGLVTRLKCLGQCTGRRSTGALGSRR